LIRTVFATTSQPFRLQGVLALMFDARSDRDFSHPCSILLADKGGGALGPARRYTLTFQLLEEGFPLFSPMIVPLTGWVVAEPGEYLLRVQIEERDLGSVPVQLRCSDRSGRSLDETTPRCTDPSPYVLRYAHLLADYNLAAYRLGALDNIVDYVRVPGQDGELCLGGFALVLFLQARVDQMAFEHRVRVQFSGTTGEIVGGERDYERAIVFQPTSDTGVGRRVPVEFSDSLRVTTGKYSFAVYLDGEQLGVHDFCVLPSGGDGGRLSNG
jgi:hypothetical protein